MSSTQSYTRFNDENYKNWLKTTESLYMLRKRIRKFIEKETETYHNSLLNKPELNGKTCKKECGSKSKPLCQLCRNWSEEIEANHTRKGNNIHWDNCQPKLWPLNKWEVAKAYMPRGHSKHNEFAQFDVAAILNLISSCKYFKNIKGQRVTNVINVRNSVMHSPDFKVSSEDVKKHRDTVLLLAEQLEPRIPELKDLKEEIKQFNNILDKNFNQAPCEVDGQQEDLQSMKNFQNILDREQQALKDRIEDFISHFEGNQDEHAKEKPHEADMKHILDFLDQNKDLLKNLAPEVDKLKEIQTKVRENEEQITKLSDRMDQLEKEKHDPVFSGNPLRYKNHLYEYCRAMKWPEDKWPVFTETQEAQGYRGKVKVNGQSFIGTNVCNDKKTAHQEVARIALEQLKLQEESADESSSSVTQHEASCSSSSGINFFGKVTVDLDREVESDGCSSKAEATEAAYKVLWESFRICAPAEGQTYRSLIMEYFNTNCFQKPTEHFVQNDDNTTTCKLKLIGPFTFYDKDGSTKKRQAEQQAAKVALQHLSGILKCVSISDNEKNFKGVLKECLETLGLKSPIYDTDNKAEISEKQVTSSISPDLPYSAVSTSQATVKDHSELKAENISTSPHPVNIPVSMVPDPQDSSFPTSLRKKPRIECLGITYFGTVTVDLKQVQSDRCSSKEEAIEAAYKVLWKCFRICALGESQTYRSVVMEYFNKQDLQQPTEEFVDDDNTTICILKFSRPFTFSDNEGSIKKKEAEQQAAKTALQHLSEILKCAPIPDHEKNFKGVLKERLETLGLGHPVYETKESKEEISKESMSSSLTPNLLKLSLSSGAMTELRSETISTSALLPSFQETVNVPVPVPVLADPQDSPGLPRKKLRTDCPEIDELVEVYNLKPPHVKVENMKYVQNFKCTVKIYLEKYTFANKKGYDTKKEATRKSYILFGRAVSILEPSTDEKTSIAEVKKHFSQKSLPLPQEDFEGSAKLFFCSLKNINYEVDYKGEGSTEDEAKLHALKNALQSLLPLFDYPPLTGADRPEEVQNQLSSLLKGANQKAPVISLDVLEQACSQLSFCDYTMKCTCQSSKRAARNHLSARILGLLGIKTDTNDPSLRNRLDEWFTKQSLPKPVFEETEEALGAKVTFTVQFTCNSPDWDDNWQTAKMKLLQLLKHRFHFLEDKNN